MSFCKTSFFFFKFIYFERETYTEREREKGREITCAHASRGGAERKRGTERIPSRLLAVRAKPGTGLDPTNLEIVT